MSSRVLLYLTCVWLVALGTYAALLRSNSIGWFVATVGLFVLAMTALLDGEQ